MTDAFALLGTALAAVGLGLIYFPLAPLFVGLLLLGLGLAGSRPPRAS